MERESATNRKRTREEDETESHAKKQDNSDDDKWYEFYDGIGVFDFPWLKEGVVFKTDDYLDDLDQEFSPCSYADETFTANLDPSCEEKLCFDINAELHEKELDVEQVDCIWSCVIDQPLDIGFHKGCVDKL